MRNRPPRSASRIAAKTLGESKRGQQYQSIVHDRMDLGRTKQLNQRGEVLPEPLGVARLSAHRAGSLLSIVAELLDLVLKHPPTGRELAPNPNGLDRRVPLDHRRPVLAPVRERGVAAEHDEPSAGPQRA